MADGQRVVSDLVSQLVVDRARFRLDLSLSVPAGRVVALLGPNGAGKSTVLQCLAGLVPLSAGVIRVGGRVVDDGGDGFVPAQERAVGMVFQDYLLFPHLSALGNVAFGLRAAGLARRPALARALSWLERMDLAALADVRPGELSGGQAQRVALARALAPGPSLLLLDEPLSALDAGTRMRVRSDLAGHLRDFAGCTVLVTHDPLDAMILADEIVVVEDGREVQRGAPGEVARAPRTDYVARLVGLNLYRGVASGGSVVLAEPPSPSTDPGSGGLAGASPGVGGLPGVGASAGGGVLVAAEPASGPVFLAFRPSAVSLHLHRPDGSARNAWPGRVTGLEQHADTVRVAIEGSPPVLADVTTASVAELGLGLGAPVWVSVKATEISVYPDAPLVPPG